jgi:mevalonate kinase
MHTALTHTAPAKIILFGEHAVVYGQPAIAVPFNTLHATAEATPALSGSGLTIVAHDLNQTLQVGALAEKLDHALVYAAHLTLTALNQPVPDLTLDLRSTIPFASGFGSGAATAAALIRALSHALGQPLDGEALNALVYEVEKMHHGTPSGIDNTVIVMNAPVYFVRGQAPQPFNVAKPLTFVIANTGVAASTKETVGAVRDLVDRDPQVYRTLIDQIGQVVQEAKTHLEKGYLLGIGHLMNLNHNCLRSLTVSSPLLERLIKAAHDAGALGAKLSGGGRGGNLIALVDPPDAEQVAAALRGAGAAQTWTMTVDATPG